MSAQLRHGIGTRPEFETAARRFWTAFLLCQFQSTQVQSACRCGLQPFGGNKTDDFVALPDRLIMQLQRSTGGLKQRQSSGNAVPLLIFTHLIPVLLAAVLWYLLSALNGRKGWFRIGEIIFWDVIILIIVLLIWLRWS
jgi:hypothetical protein